MDQVERVFSVGPFFRNELILNNDIELVGGIRYDQVYFQVGDRFLDDGNQSGSRTLSQLTGTIGAVFHWDDELYLYGNVATAFETPTTVELINNPSGTGGFNIDLNSKILRHNQLVVLSDSYELKIVEALAGIDPRELLKVKGFGRRTIGQIEDLLWHYYIYTLDSYKHGEAHQAALNNHWHFKTSD